MTIRLQYRAYEKFIYPLIFQITMGDEEITRREFGKGILVATGALVLGNELVTLLTGCASEESVMESDRKELERILRSSKPEIISYEVVGIDDQELFEKYGNVYVEQATVCVKSGYPPFIVKAKIKTMIPAKFNDDHHVAPNDEPHNMHSASKHLYVDTKLGSGIRPGYCYRDYFLKNGVYNVNWMISTPDAPILEKQGGVLILYYDIITTRDYRTLERLNLNVPVKDILPKMWTSSEMPVIHYTK